MGQKQSHFSEAYDECESAEEFAKKYFRAKKSWRQKRFPRQAVLAHFTPSVFPLVPLIFPWLQDTCKRSWKSIVAQDVAGPAGNVISGITVFYDEFYARLALLDNNGKFERVLTSHAGGQNKIAAKGAILIRVLKYILLVSEDNEKTRRSLDVLGSTHTKMGIRPWQYACFGEVLLSTMASRLGANASNTVMECWVNLLAYAFQHMLHSALKGQSSVDVREFNINSKMTMEEIKEEQDAHSEASAYTNGDSVSVSRRI